MRLLILITLLVPACATATVGSGQGPATTPCPEPPPPPPSPSVRAAAAYFELQEISRWADERADAQEPPALDEIVEHLRAAVEAMRAAEEAAAAARAYEVAETARMSAEDLLVRMVELGVELPPEVHQSLALAEEGEQIVPLQDPDAELPGVLEDLAILADDAQEVAIQVAELESITAADSADRASAGCLMARLEAYADLEELVAMLEEDAVDLRVAAQQGVEPEERAELAALERQLDLSQAILVGLRRGAVQTVEAVGPVFQLSAEASDAAELHDIANDLIDACRAAAARERGATP